MSRHDTDTEGELTPRAIVRELDRHIVGQDRAKRAVAVALRNRHRRRQLEPELREEVLPKNILMMGPTGVGKTEIARRLAALAQSPFIKVEATKYTEVGYVGRDVESMVRDLLETSIRMVTAERAEAVRARADGIAVDRIVDILEPEPSEEPPAGPPSPFQALLTGVTPPPRPKEPPPDAVELARIRRVREELRERVRAGELDDRRIAIEVADTSKPMVEVFSGTGGIEEINMGGLTDMLGSIMPRKKKRRRTTVGEARKLLADQAAQELLDQEEITREAIERAEESGIIFIDEIDKIAERGGQHSGPDVSREGVQRDILPIVEGCTVPTKHGSVRTDHVLFITAGAFHSAKVSDLIPELQGRLPIRVELDSLTEEDFVRILTEPENSLTMQAEALLATEGVTLTFTEDGLREIAATAKRVNDQRENIGARRLHTIMERVLDEVSFDADELSGTTVTIDAEYVRERLKDDLAADDLARYIL